MKEVKKSKEIKPTLTSVMGAVQDLTETVQDLTVAVQTGFAKVEERFDNLETGFERHEGILKTLVEGQDELRESVHVLDQRVSKTQNRIEDVVDENQGTLLDHGRRITVLEKARA